MSITYGDHLIDKGHYDITPEQEREIEAREECARLGIDPDEICADGGVTAWMVVDKEMRDPLGASLEVAREYRKMLETQQKRIEALEAALREARGSITAIAAECHRTKWQFDFNDENRMPVSQARYEKAQAAEGAGRDNGPGSGLSPKAQIETREEAQAARDEGEERK